VTAPTFPGRPATAPPGYVPSGGVAGRPTAGERRLEELREAARRGRRVGRLWLVQALTGGFLLVFLGVHLVAQHLLAPGGLRDYASVVAYLREPIALTAELGLVASVLVHVVLGIRAVAVDGFSAAGVRWITRVATVAGAAAFVYACWLTWTIVR
jgi:succinate dehydrogenase hydrophobic anchor subunit